MYCNIMPSCLFLVSTAAETASAKASGDRFGIMWGVEFCWLGDRFSCLLLVARAAETAAAKASGDRLGVMWGVAC
jgi:hypothetical protein